MLSPAVGGSVDGEFGWRAIFWVLAAAGAMLFAYCWVDFEETNMDLSGSAKDQLGAYPILLRSARFWGYAVCLACSTGTFYAFLVGVPLTAKVLLNLSPTALGGYIGTITLGSMLGELLIQTLFASTVALQDNYPRAIYACVGPLMDSPLHDRPLSDADFGDVDQLTKFALYT